MIKVLIAVHQVLLGHWRGFLWLRAVRSTSWKELELVPDPFAKDLAADLKSEQLTNGAWNGVANLTMR
jgi:hypothetical protein